jgi:hypothetical protein
MRARSRGRERGCSLRPPMASRCACTSPSRAARSHGWRKRSPNRKPCSARSISSAWSQIGGPRCDGRLRRLRPRRGGRPRCARARGGGGRHAGWATGPANSSWRYGNPADRTNTPRPLSQESPHAAAASATDDARLHELIGRTPPSPWRSSKLGRRGSGEPGSSKTGMTKRTGGLSRSRERKRGPRAPSGRHLTSWPGRCLCTPSGTPD